MYIHGTDLVSIVGDDDEKYTQNGGKRRYLHHYTDLKSLKCILEGSMLKLNSIENLNDRFEAKQFGDSGIMHTAFVSSFSHERTKESIPMWHMYTEKHGDGLKLSLYFKKGFSANSLVNRNGLVKAYVDEEDMQCDEYPQKMDQTQLSNKWFIKTRAVDVCYNLASGRGVTIPWDNDKKYVIDRIALRKDAAWSFEHETRFVSLFRVADRGGELKKYAYLLLPITFDVLKKIVITYSPWMTITKKKELEEWVKSFNCTCEIVTQDSRFTELIKRKL